MSLYGDVPLYHCTTVPELWYAVLTVRMLVKRPLVVGGQPRVPLGPVDINNVTCLQENLYPEAHLLAHLYPVSM